MTLDDLRKIAEAATSGPWTVEQEVEETDFGKFEIFSVDPVTAFSWYDDSAMAHTALDTLEEADAEFIATFNPQKVLEFLDQIEQLQARLAAVEEMHVPQPGLGPAYCTECDQLHPCDTTKAARGE